MLFRSLWWRSRVCQGGGDHITDGVDRIAAALVRRGVRFIVAEMSPRYHIAAGVTDRQRQVVNLAVAEGYYDIPRRVSQAGIAATLEVDKSVVNRILRRAERHLITAAASRWSDLPHR